jgi:hypothetical protein
MPSVFTLNPPMALVNLTVNPFQVPLNEGGWVITCVEILKIIGNINSKNALKDIVML